MSSQDTTSLLPENAPPLPSGTPPLPPSAPPSATSMYSMPPPNMNTMSAAAYQQYYQQYMQYMYLYGASSAAASMPSGYASYNFPSSSSKPPNAPITSTAATTSSTPTSISLNRPTQADAKPEQKQSAIKINLNFKSQTKPEQQQQQQQPKRFTPQIGQLSNIQAEQENFKKKEQEASLAAAEVAKTADTLVKKTETKPEVDTTQPAVQADIVSDINKWPASLKAYCTKVYQHYQKQTQVSEDQVTKYLQHRITETFKCKPDLQINWHEQRLPEVSEIKQVAPYSQAQLEQQKRNKKLHEAALALAKAKAAELLSQKEKVKQQLADAKKTSSVGLAAEISSKLSKRKYDTRSRSNSPSSTTSSSSSSSSSSTPTKTKSDYIELSSSSKKVKKSHAMMKIEKKKLKNIQINSVNGKKSFMLVDAASKSKRKSNEETSDGEEEEESDGDEEDEIEEKMSGDEENEQAEHAHTTTGDLHQKLLTTPNKFLSKKQKKIKANLINRQKRFQDQLSNTTTTTNINYNKNKKFFTNRQNVRTLFSSTNRESINEDADMNEVCVGLNQDLEKEYLRLTGPPEPAMIRPLSVLKKSLVYVLDKYSKSNDYRYICDQLKAIRQDLTVQMIQNEFTIEVYETHARIAIRTKDREEFNQCQSQLKNLYILNEKNAKVDDSHSAEFVGYRLLYNMLTKSHTDLNQVIKEIKRKYSTHAYLTHLLALRNAWHLNNYVKFFRLYKQCNDLSKCLIDLFIERERKLALKTIIKAYRPSIKLECVKEMLAYESLQKCKDDLVAYKLNVQSVPVALDSTNTTTTTTKSSNLKSTTTKSTDLMLSKQTFEDVLDCKSCSIQAL